MNIIKIPKYADICLECQHHIRHQDEIMLNHEFLECTLMKQGMKSWEAHDAAQGVYDYSTVMEDD